MLIVVTLLAFIVMLLMGLAAYTRIETAIAGNTQRQAQARENALLALEVALGQLQRYAGPDTRVTATAQNFGGANGTRPYTGVWSSDPAAGTTPATPLTWLVSGNEFSVPDTSEGAPEGATVPAPLAVLPSTNLNRLQPVDLVGRFSTGTTSRTNYVAAPSQAIRARNVPGAPTTGETVIGRYAWWVGDQGVKAPVAVPDVSSAVTYAPYDSAELRSRIRQQFALGAGAAEIASGEARPVFEPRDNYNSSLVANQKVIAAGQFAFLRNSSNSQIGLTRVQQNFHHWSPNNLAVLANTKTGGLRQDLSLAPSLLGGAFAAWVNYASYLESPVNPETPENPEVPVAEGEETAPTTPAFTTPTISPAYGSDPLRRRYVMTPHLAADNASHQVGPVLTYFLLTFNVRTVNGSAATRPLEVRARWMVSLWNPYTSALVPENLRLAVTGLPATVRVVKHVDEETVAPVGSFSLVTAYGSPPVNNPDGDGGGAVAPPLLINLPWTAAETDGDLPADRQSWLPGRLYSWCSQNIASDVSAPSAAGYESVFYSQSLSNASGAGVIRPLDLESVDGDQICHLEIEGVENLGVTIYAIRPDGPVRLAALTSPQFVASFATNPQKASGGDYQFSYVFRLAESIDTPSAPGTWLTTEGRDLREPTLPSSAYVVAENGNDPAQYGASYSKIRNPDRLLDRSTGSRSYNEDVPVFELPRAPLLSLGAVQHLFLPGQRPFAIGNSWGANYELNGLRTAELFDRFFFSGLVDGLTPATTSTGDLILPNPLLRPLRSWDTELQAYRKPTADDLRATLQTSSTETTTDPDTGTSTETTTTVPGTVRSSQYLVQAGAFNLNSTSTVAWASVLRGVRFPSSQSLFSYLNASASTGTAADTSKSTVQSTSAQFFRFSQSAQETYKAEAGAADNDEEIVSAARTDLFRRGMRTLSASEVSILAAKIVEYVALKHANDGPFRSLDEFLSPNSLFAQVDGDGNAGGARSLLEAAIADAKTTTEETINGNVPEFSSQWLTQADIMTALAPVLFPRSDTFMIRTYGEAINPATGQAEGRAWCEAIVQRVPEYFDRKDNEDDPSGDPPAVLPADLTSDLNKTLGRRFKVVAFRWLTRSDI